jgi:hypothetical protein
MEICKGIRVTSKWIILVWKNYLNCVFCEDKQMIFNGTNWMPHLCTLLKLT